MKLATRCGLAIFFSAVGVAAIGASAEAKTNPRITLVLGATGTEFAGEQRAGALAAIRDLKGAVKLKISGPAQIDPGQEVKIFQSEAATLPDAIILAPIPPSLFTEPVLQAQAQHIPVAYLMSPPSKGVQNVLFVGQREYDVGRRVANLIADQVIAKAGKPANAITGTMVPGSCVPGMENLDDRMQGVHTALKERLPKVNLLADLSTANERAATFAIWQQAVQAHPDALAFIGACEGDFVNLAKIKEDDRRGFTMVVFDTPEAVRNSIKKGTITAAAPPSHFTSAYMAVWLVGNALLKDQKIPTTGWLETPITVINSTNIAAFDKASLPPANLETFYKKDIDALKAKDPSKLPATSTARAPGKG